jgi:3D (Asp-Asp-Asp) domain-containing protein
MEGMKMRVHIKKRIAVLTAVAILFTLFQLPTSAAKVSDEPGPQTKPIIYTVTVDIPQTEYMPQPQTDIQPTLIDAGIFTVTAYSPDPQDSGRWGTLTKSGVTAVEGVTIAADWSVLPPGTEVYIDGVGYRTVQDVGGAVKGRHIDVYLNTHAQAEQFGKQRLEIYVSKEG